jgi:hypothetical protein
MRLKRSDTAQRARRVLRREAGWTSTYALDGGLGQKWRTCQVLDLSREGAGVLLLDISPEELRARRVVIQLPIDKAVLHLCGDVRHITPYQDGAVGVGLQFSGLSPFERDLLDAVLDHRSA